MHRFRVAVATAMFLVGLISGFSVNATDYTSSDFILRDPVLTDGGGFSSSSGFQFWNTLGEQTFGQNASESNSQRSGFLYFPVATGAPIVTATAGNARAILTWTAASTALGLAVASYDVGQGTVSGGPYSFTSVGNVLTNTPSNLTNGTAYYFVIRARDAHGEILTTSAQATATPRNGGSTVSGGATSSFLTFHGWANPFETVVIDQNGIEVARVPVDGSASFVARFNNVATGEYLFSFHGESAQGDRSNAFLLPVYFVSNSMMDVAGILLPPSATISHTQFALDDVVIVSGKTVPGALATATVNSNQPVVVSATADSSGSYQLSIPANTLVVGSYSLVVRAIYNGVISSPSFTLSFIRTAKSTEESVGSIPIQPVPSLKPGTSGKHCGRGDLNCDGRVNIVDFSIAAFWYKHTLNDAFRSIEVERLNGDGKVTFVDFSILVFYWTG